VNSRQLRTLADHLEDLADNIQIEGGWPVIIAGAFVACAAGSSWAGIAFLFAYKIFALYRRRRS
jgi:hypothetical protein